MKYILVLLTNFLITTCLLSCNENNEATFGSGDTGQDSTITKPAEANLSPQKVQDQIDKEVYEALSSDSIKTGTAVVIAETHNAMVYLLDSNYTAAIKAIETAIGKAEVITAANPNIGFIPIERDVIVRDLVTDIQTLRKAKDDIEDLTDKGYLQAARKLVEVLVSEININTARLPLATYPAALKTAVSLAREKKHVNAALLLNTALNTIVVEERSIPLPIVRAELLLTIADSLITSNSKEEEINLLLDNADYQIRFAEELGYGQKDKEFEELYDDIKRLKKEVKGKGSDRQNMVTGLRSRLTEFKKRISPETKQ